MPLKWRPDMTPEDEAALLRESDTLDQCYAAAFGACMPSAEEGEDECFDPVRDGWVGKDGRP